MAAAANISSGEENQRNGVAALAKRGAVVCMYGGGENGEKHQQAAKKLSGETGGEK